MSSCPDAARAAGSRIVDRPSDLWGTATPLACASQMLLMMGEDGASNRRGPMKTEEGKAAIDAEKEDPAPTIPNLEAGVEGSSLAPSQFTIPVATIVIDLFILDRIRLILL